MKGESAAAEGSQRGTAEVSRVRGEMQLEEERQAGLATLVVVERPSTCQDSHLTGKPGASQGSLLRLAQGVP